MLLSKTKYRIYFSIALLCLVSLSILGVIQYKTNLRTSLKKAIVKNDMDITYGSDTSAVYVFMFLDYNCTHCRRFLIEVLPQIKEHFIAKGKVRFTLKLLTFSNNERLLSAYKTALCLNKYGDFEMLNQLLLYENEAIYSAAFDELVSEYTMRNSYFAECYLGDEAQNCLNQNMALFLANQFKGTPTFVIANKVYRGFMDFEKFSSLLAE